mgnify:CR=1 FL=1
MPHRRIKRITKQIWQGWITSTYIGLIYNIGSRWCYKVTGEEVNSKELIQREILLQNPMCWDIIEQDKKYLENNMQVVWHIEYDIVVHLQKESTE